MDPVAGLVAVLTLTPMAASVNPGAAITLGGQNTEMHGQDLRAQELEKKKAVLLKKRAKLQARDVSRYSARLKNHIAQKIAAIDRELAQLQSPADGTLALK